MTRQATSNMDGEGDQVSGILGRLSGRSVRCYNCGEWFRVAVRAESASCTHCFKQVHIRDITVKEQFWGSSIMTCGRIAIGRKGFARVKLIVACHGIDIEGHAEGLVASGGPVRLGRDAFFKGTIEAPSLIVDPGAIIEVASIKVPSNPIGQIELPKLGAGRVIASTPAARA
ncbi:MAG: hypothetical protein CMJ31_14315 [Phycisphaerae bacterium]|nr:hypothetical protein [Phycisphaerae bacterium]